MRLAPPEGDELREGLEKLRDGLEPDPLEGLENDLEGLLPLEGEADPEGGPDGRLKERFGLLLLPGLTFEGLVLLDGVRFGVE